MTDTSHLGKRGSAFVERAGVLLLVMVVGALLLILNESQVMTGATLEQNRPEFEMTWFGNSMETTIFSPGSLELEREQVLGRCYAPLQNVDLSKVIGNMRGGIRCFYHHELKTLGFTLPKSGSSSAGHLFKEMGFTQCLTNSCWNLLQGRDKLHKTDREPGPQSCYNITKIGIKNLRTYLIYRDPVDRLLSGIGEAQLRLSRSFDRISRLMPPKFDSLAERVYRAIPGNSEEMKRKYIDIVQSDVGKQLVAEAIRDFGDVFDVATDLFDIHLVPQLLFLANSAGNVLQFNKVLTIREFGEEAERLQGEELFVSIPKNLTRRRKGVSKDKASSLTDERQKRLCKAVIADYCCFNLKLPKACLGALENGNYLGCVLSRKGGRYRVGSAFANNSLPENPVVVTYLEDEEA